MTSKVKNLLQYMRLQKVVGPTVNDQVAHLMYQSSDTLLLKYTSSHLMYSSWILVRRTSRQYYRVLALTKLYDDEVVKEKSFRTADSTCLWIKELIRRY